MPQGGTTVRETRIFAAPIEVREPNADSPAPMLVGYGAMYGNEYEVNGFTESVAPTAFTRSLKNNHDHAVVISHDFARVLGTEESGTARFSSDERGLRYEADLDLEDPDGMSAYRKAKTRRMTQSSFSFEVLQDRWEERGGAMPHRTLTEVRLYECSPVLFGANPTTSVDIKRAAHSYAEFRGIDCDGPDIATIREATTPDPEPDPVIDHSDATQAPEAKRRTPTLPI
jgi:HK97 family phage prohead protease